MSDKPKPTQEVQQDIWASIRRDREQGVSLRTLALKYGKSKSYLGQVLSSGQTPDTGQAQKTPELRTPPAIAEPTASQSLTVTIARTLIKKIAKQVLADSLDAKEMKLLADTLSQCNKIIVGEEVEGQELSPYDLRTFLAKCTPDELQLIQPVMDAVAARKPANITPMRRVS